MFRKVLVANRGEIACRILRTLQAMGLSSVAVYHHLDRGAPHVSMAGEAVAIESATPIGAYLDAEQIIAIARRCGAEAIHPGYGFLSENADFAERVAAAGLAFIGPDAATIRLMGDKIAARAFAARHGVALAPSVTQEGAFDTFLDQAASIGFPLLIKAAAGGGGKGMKIARSAAELADSARLAASEAERYFRDGRIYAERLIDMPRHIEVQILGDGKGNAVHLCERECSMQRRYQKIVEEAPAPNLSAELRDRIRAAAIRLAAAARYKNAGTVEFILAPDGAFYFLEMNTRLQVEHPVTEAVLGVDLVREQLLVAAGNGLSFTQDQLHPAGHAVECRICAEEPDRDFRPAAGRIGILRVPEGQSIRFDSGIREGQTISASFDSMLAKLIVWGPTRAEAVARMETALHDLTLLGLPTNIDYLARIVAHPEFAAGRLDTGFLGRHAAWLTAPDPAPEIETAVLAAAALADPDFHRAAFDLPEPHASIGHWRN